MSDGIQGYAYGSRYRPSWPTTLRALLYIVIGRRRSLARDAFYALRDAPRPPLVRGEDRIPASGPFVVCANHYERPGLWMAWQAVLVSGLTVLIAILGFVHVPCVGTVLEMVFAAGLFVMVVIGIVNALQGQAKELPFIGPYASKLPF